MKRNAEITSVLSFKEDNEIRIEISQDEPVIQREMNEIILNEHSNSSKNISYDELLNKSFAEKDLLVKVNDWAITKKFKLYFSEGPKNMKKGTKRSLSCCVSSCSYKIIFINSKTNNQYRVYQTLSKKYTSHSNLFVKAIIY